MTRSEKGSKENPQHPGVHARHRRSHQEREDGSVPDSLPGLGEATQRLSPVFTPAVKCGLPWTPPANPPGSVFPFLAGASRRAALGSATRLVRGAAPAHGAESAVWQGDGPALPGPRLGMPPSACGRQRPPRCKSCSGLGSILPIKPDSGETGRRAHVAHTAELQPHVLPRPSAAWGGCCQGGPCGRSATGGPSPVLPFPQVTIWLLKQRAAGPRQTHLHFVVKGPARPTVA